jgi:hypothetical protein
LDGRKIYQKTIRLPPFSTNNFPHLISNISYVTSIAVIGFSPSNGFWIAIPFNDIDVWLDSTSIYTQTTFDRTAWNDNWVTVQYTCTDR